jgi:hypothetical protein
VSWSLDDIRQYVVETAPDGELQHIVEAIRENTTDQTIVDLIDFWDDTIHADASEDD